MYDLKVRTSAVLGIIGVTIANHSESFSPITTEQKDGWFDWLIRGNSVEESVYRTKRSLRNQTGSWAVVACLVYRKTSTDARPLRLSGTVERISGVQLNNTPFFKRSCFGRKHKYWTYSSRELIHAEATTQHNTTQHNTSNSTEE
jgi:hypothetical protein